MPIPLDNCRAESARESRTEVACLISRCGLVLISSDHTVTNGVLVSLQSRWWGVYVALPLFVSGGLNYPKPKTNERLTLATSTACRA